MAFSKATRILVHSKYNERCAYCGTEILIKDMQVDHIIPQRNFIMHVKNVWKVPVFLRHLTVADVDHIDNLNPSCRTCNKWKDTHDLELFRSELGSQVKRLNEYSSNFRIAKKYGLVTEVVKPIQFYFETVIQKLQ